MPMTTTPQQFIDLHIHSNFSDGAFTPSEVIDMAHRANLTAIAIADHDSINGVPEGITSGNRVGVRVIPAVELSVQFEEWQDVHLLGYGVDYQDGNFLERLNGFRERRERRNEEILERVNQLLIQEGKKAIQLEEVLAYAQDTIGRPHIARALLEHSHAESVEDAFRRYLVPCNVPKSYWPMEDAIKEIRRTGGVAILAHPTTISRDQHELRRVITTLHDLGLDGIEVYNNLVYPDDMEFLRRLAIGLNLIMTGGSDFHGIEEGLEMGKGRGGIRFSEDLLTPLLSLLSERKIQGGVL